MPTNKDSKRLVRARMQKTGEAYTTARAHLLQKNEQPRPVCAPSGEKSMRMTWPDETSVELYFADRGTVKSQVQIQHRKLWDRAAATGMKRYWEERLAALQQVLVPAP
jgi:hypothetical protein